MTNGTRGLSPVIIHAVVDDEANGRRGVTAADFDDKLEAIEFLLSEVRDEFHWRLVGSKVGKLADKDRFDFMAALYLTAWHDVRREFTASSAYAKESDPTVH